MKSPGIDELLWKFYRGFLSWRVLSVLNESLKEGSLTLSCRRGVITLLSEKCNVQEQNKLESCKFNMK